MRVAALSGVHGNLPALRDVSAGASLRGQISGAEATGLFEEHRGA